MPNRKRRIKNIFNHYGARNQLLKCAEETAEFQTELMKAINGKGNRENILSELADLYITTEYVQLAYDISDTEIGYEIEKKLVRQEHRIEGGL